MAEKALKALKLSSLQECLECLECRLHKSFCPSHCREEIKALGKPPDGVRLTLEATHLQRPVRVSEESESVSHAPMIP